MSAAEIREDCGIASSFASLFLESEMSGSVTARAERDEVFFGIIAEPAA